MSQSLRNIARITPHETALLHAKEKMNEELLRAELGPEIATGRWDDGYRWRVEIAPYAMSAAPLTGAAVQLPAAGTPALFTIRLQVAWGDPQQPRTYEVATTQWARWMGQR
jgi:hypothetical protein